MFNGTQENVNAWRTMLEPVEEHGGSVLFVLLTCECEELFRRVRQEDRRTLDKLVDAARMSALLSASTCSHPARSVAI